MKHLTTHDKIENEGLALSGRQHSHPRPIALPEQLAFSFVRFPFPTPAHNGSGVDYQSSRPGTSRCEEGFGDSVELRDYRVSAGLAGGKKASARDSAATADTNKAKAWAGSKDGFDCLG